MSDDLTRVCSAWIADGMGDDCFWESWAGCPTPDQTLTPNMVAALAARAERAEAALATARDDALEAAAVLVESTAYTSTGEKRSLEPVSRGLQGHDTHHATIAAAIRALKGGAA